MHFAYEASRPILHGISFTVPAGKTVAVVGPSGAGKSTLARLLFRFYDVQSGTIASPGKTSKPSPRPACARPSASCRRTRCCSTTPWPTTSPTAAPARRKREVEEAAKSARIHDFIRATPKGYETMVGERGLKLSGGEKQRVAIARTLLKNPPILIFDEATSALDSANERAIQAELQNVAQNKTTLVIAHRLSTVVDAHEILVMDAGQIVERGNHAQLLALKAFMPACGRCSKMAGIKPCLKTPSCPSIDVAGIGKLKCAVGWEGSQNDACTRQICNRKRARRT